jgi:filamentous hemagglutinin family protein
MCDFLGVRRVVAGLLAMAAMGQHQAHAAPQGGVVAQGNASIQSPNAATLNIVENSQRAVINWSSFSIAGGERVTFLQPSADSFVLNRVTGGSRSVIDGALSANGNIFLLNPSGILFGSHATVNVGGLLATTSSIADDQFMQGQLTFTPSKGALGAVENLGSLSARDGGMIALVAPTVRNAGVISAHLGRVALGAGEHYTLDLYGDRLINFVLPDKETKPASYRLDQDGQVLADGGRVLLTADSAVGVVSAVVNMSGVARADTLRTGKHGEIVLDAGPAGTLNVSGTVEAAGTEVGARGGDIQALGADIRLGHSATIDASGNAGGGTAEIGATSLSGTHPENNLDVEGGAVIDVSARQSGNGGGALLWGGASNTFRGEVLAVGGSAAGAGGRVDVSTAATLDFDGNVDVTAVHGRAGDLVLDPANILITTVGSTGPVNAISVISATRLDSLLRAGDNVALEADNSIVVAAPIDGRPLAAASNTPSGSFSLTGGTLFIDNPIVTNNAGISLNSTHGNVNFSGLGLAYVANGATSSLGTGPITITSAQNVLTTNPSSSATGQFLTAGALQITAGGNLTLPPLEGLSATATGVGPVTVRAGGTLATNGIQSTGAIDLTGGAIMVPLPLITSNGPITLTSTSGDVTFSGSGAAYVSNSGASPAVGTAAISIDSAQRVTVAAGSSATAGQLLTAGPVTLTAGSDVTLPTLAGVQGSAGIGDLNITSAGSVSLQGAQSTGAVTVQGAAVTNSSAPIVAAGNISLTSTGSGGIILNCVGTSSQCGAAGAPGVAVSSSGGTVTLAQTTPAPVQLAGSLQTSGKDIVIGTATQPAGSITMAANTVLQTVAAASSPQNGGISLSATGPIKAETLLVGASGAVTIDTSGQGSVTLDTPLIGLPGATTAAGVGSVTINAAGAFNNPGIQSNGPISLSAGSITDSQPLIANNAPISLTSSSGDIIFGGSGTVYVKGPGTPAVGTAAITIDSAQKVGIAPGASTSAGQLVTVGAVTVIAGSDVSLPTLGGATGSGGVGDLTITAGGALNLNGAQSTGAVSIQGASVTNSTTSIIAAGDVKLTSTGSGGITLSCIGDTAACGTGGVPETAISSSGGGVTLAQTSPGPVVIDGNILTLGQDIVVGTAAQPVGSITMAANTVLQTIVDRTSPQGGGLSLHAAGPIETRTLMPGSSAAVNIGTTGAQGTVTLDTPLLGYLYNTQSGATYAGVGQVVVSASRGFTGGAIQTTSGPLTITAGGLLQVGSLQARGDLELTGQGITATGDLFGANITLQSTGQGPNTIQLTAAPNRSGVGPTIGTLGNLSVTGDAQTSFALNSAGPTSFVVGGSVQIGTQATPLAAITGNTGLIGANPTPALLQIFSADGQTLQETFYDYASTQFPIFHFGPLTILTPPSTTSALTYQFQVNSPTPTVYTVPICPTCFPTAGETNPGYAFAQSPSTLSLQPPPQVTLTGSLGDTTIQASGIQTMAGAVIVGETGTDLGTSLSGGALVDPLTMASDINLHRTSRDASTQNDDSSDVSCPRGAGTLADLGNHSWVEGPARNVFRRCRETNRGGGRSGT